MSGELLSAGRLVEARYRVVRPLARGGMGVVYLVIDEVDQRRLALKTLPLADGPDPLLVKRIEQEAELGAEVEHPNIARTHHVGWLREGAPFVLMELLRGETLMTRLEGEGTLRPREVLGMGVELLDAIRVIHEAGILHRDLKATNIFLHQEKGRTVAKIIDFGFARRVGERRLRLTAPAVALGTLSYMAPELFLGREHDPRADLYSFSVTLYLALSGRRPFELRSGEGPMAFAKRMSSSAAPPIRSHRRDLPEALDPFFAKALAPASERFRSAAEMAEAMRALIG